ncbi:MAG: hypothetical protein ACREI9_02585 [Nitrospiraceae bacterium]
MRKTMILGSLVLSVLILSPHGFADEGTQRTAGTRMKVSGVVSKVQAGRTTIKTPWGSMTIASDSGPKNLEVGEEVEMQVNENNAVIDVHRKGEPAHGHRYVTGKLIYVGKTKKEIKLWTPEGEKVFPLERLEVKARPIKEGSTVTVELNESGTVIDLRRGLTVDMTFDENPRTKLGYQIEVDGVVTAIKSGTIIVKSSVGRYTISAKSAPSDAKVGDKVTLWVNEENMVVDHHRKGHKKAHRLVSGKLIYAGKTKDQIKLWTPEGEKVFPLERMEVKTKPIEEGSMIVVELNEDGTVVDLRKAQ